MSKMSTCRVCNRQYIQPPGSIYKIEFADKICRCCSYTCYQMAKTIKASVNEAEYRRKNLTFEDAKTAYSLNE